MTTGAKQSLKKGGTWLIGSAVVMAIGAGGWWFSSGVAGRSSGAIAADVIIVKRDTVEETVSESGAVELSNQQQLKAAVEKADTVDQVLVKVGDRVRAGQPLIILRNPDQQTKLAEHNLDIEKAQADVLSKQQQVDDKRDELLNTAADKALDVQKQSLTLANSRNSVQRSRDKLMEAQQKFKLHQEAFDKGFISADELASRRDDLRNAETEVEQAESNVMIANLNLNQTTAQLEQARRKVETGSAEAEQAFQSALRELEKLQLQSQKIEQELQTNVITAPSTGIVLDVQARRGDVVNAEKVLLTIGNPIREIVNLKLSPLNARKVKPSQIVRIRELVPNAKTYMGRVESVARIATSGDSSSQSSSGDPSQATLAATVRLDSPSRTLIPGIQVDVEIIVAQRKDAIALPPEVIQRSDGEPFVWVLDPQKRAQKRTIVLGLEAITMVEVTTGLKPGDRVLQLPPDTSITPGTVIKSPTVVSP